MTLIKRSSSENCEVVDFGFTHKLPVIKLKRRLEKYFGFKLLVDNNANTRALGEYWYGHGSGIMTAFMKLALLHLYIGSFEYIRKGR